VGDRATIRVKQAGSETAIHFYTHWTGGSVDRVVSDALHRAEEAHRLSDPEYCTRILFDTLTSCEGGTLGYGIIIGDENRPGDVEYDSPSVEWVDHLSEPCIRYMTRYGHFTGPLVPWRDWVKDGVLS